MQTIISINKIKSKELVAIICCLLIFLFTYTALSKLINRDMFEAQLFRMPLISGVAVLLSWVIPLIELIIVALLLHPRCILTGLYITVILLTAFTGFLIILINADKPLPCSCGGAIAILSWPQHIFFNLFFLTLCLAGIFIVKQNKHKDIITSGSAPANVVDT